MRPGFFAFAVACAFVGAALYINVVEQPARLMLDARSMIQEWLDSNRRGFLMLATLAILSAILAYVDFGHSGDVRWLIGGTIILATGLYAYFVVVPVNVWLWTLPPDAEGSPVRELVRDWGLLEWGQTAIGFAGCWILGWAVVLPV
ncbi:anthrone oxygenase family protein [Microvirga sp. 2TAF3]|uniref:anthrone oxygenase family protein n=1 Tax=Microvirga sp. 2TAF3 TaxID=3233014 RepID=UPI003F9BEDA8